MSLLLCVSMLKACMISHQIFYFLLFFLAFKSKSGKNIFVTSFPFLTDSFKPPPLVPHPPPLPQFVRGFQALPLFEGPTLEPAFPLLKIFVSPPFFYVPPGFKLFQTVSPALTQPPTALNLPWFRQMSKGRYFQFNCHFLSKIMFYFKFKPSTPPLMTKICQV